MRGIRLKKHTCAALVVVVAGVVASCGSSSKSSTGGTASTGPASTAASTTSGGPTTTSAPEPRPTSLVDWEQRWAKERAAEVKKITDNKWGKSADGKTLTGPAGFKIDLGACPAGWSDTEGLTDTSIKIGSTAFLSGAASDYGNLTRAAAVIFDYYSKQGAFKDSLGKNRKIDFIYRDDAYDPAKTIPLTDEFIDSDKVFAVLTNGSPTGLKVYEKLNQRCVPQPLETTGLPAWGDPVNHPWTTGSNLSYSTEALLWGAFLDQHIAEFGTGKIKIAALAANSDFGNAYDSFFRAYLAQSENKDRYDLVTEKVEFSAPTVTDPMTTLNAAQPQVFIAMTGGAQCPQIINEAAQNGMKAKTKYMFISSTCKGASFVGKAKVGGDGSASDGWWIVGGGQVDFNSSAYDNDAYVSWGRQLLSAAGYDYKQSGSFGLGFFYTFPMVEALQIADDLPGGLTRTNLILALRAMDITHPMLLPGVKYNMNGNADAFLLEGSDISRYDSAKQQWIQQGPIVELSGKSKNCKYDQAKSACTLY